MKLAELSLGPSQRRIVVADDFIAPEAVPAIHAKLRYRAFTLNDSDRPDTAGFNHFKHDFDTEPATGDPLILLIADRARALLGELGVATGSLLRIYANLNMFGDYQFEHCDGEGFTALLFANRRWDNDWGGEILFHPDDGSPFLHAIRPQPGRIILFDGKIRHRGGVPSKFCHEPRLSLVIKFARGR